MSLPVTGGNAERGEIKGKENISVVQQNPTAVATSGTTGRQWPGHSHWH